MSEKSTPTFGGFEALSDMLIKKDGAPLNTEVEDDIPEIEPEELEKKISRKTVKKEVEEEPEEVVEEEEVEEETEETPSEETDDITEAEPEIATFVADKLASELNWDLKDEKFESIGDVIDYMAAIVEENSKPSYASDEVQRFDEYVKNGGDLRTFYTSVYSGKIDPEKVDLDVAENQRSIVREHLRNLGYKEEKINSAITRYEEKGVLEDEAVDALESVKEFNDTQKEKLLNDQRKLADEYKKEQQKFYSNVQKSIEDIEDIRGIQINKKQKVELLEYIFRPDENGTTQYQKDYSSNIKHLVESAFLVKEGDKLFKKVEEKAKSEAYKSLQDKLKANKGKRNKTIDS
jgi:hypothetical protein